MEIMNLLLLNRLLNDVKNYVISLVRKKLMLFDVCGLLMLILYYAPFRKVVLFL